MAIKYLTSINLLSNELQNAVIQPLSTAPTSPKAGQIYYNSTDKFIYRYDGATWGPVGVVYNQGSSTGAVITGLDNTGKVTTTNVIGLTLAGYTPVEDGYVSADMTVEAALKALDQAVKNAVAGGGEVNQNAFSNVTVKKQSEAVTAVAGQAADATITATAKTDTITMATGNKWVDVNGTGKTITVGHALSGVTAGATGDASHVAKVTVDAAGHVTAVDSVEITPAAIGADIAGAAAAVLGEKGDTADKDTVFGAKAAAEAAQGDAAAAEAIANEKVASVTAATNGGITVGGTATAPTVGIKLDPAEGNIATLSDAGLKVTAPTVNVPVYSLTKDATSTGYAAVYHLTKDGTNVGEAINIPKDLFVESGEIVENPAGQPEGKYLKLVLQNQTAPVYINVADLVDAYTAGNGISISETNEVSAKVVADNGLSVDATGIKMGLASGDASGAMSSAHYTKLEGIEEGATKNSIMLNGDATKNPSFYAPTTAGTEGQLLFSSGGAAPVWGTFPTLLKKYTNTNGALTASGGAFAWTIAFGTHGVSTPVTVQVYEVATGAMVMTDVSVASNGNVTITINGTGTLTANTYRVVIIG